MKRKYQNFSIIEKNAGEGKFQAEKIGRKRKPLRDAENVGLQSGGPLVVLVIIAHPFSSFRFSTRNRDPDSDVTNSLFLESFFGGLDEVSIIRLVHASSWVPPDKCTVGIL